VDVAIAGGGPAGLAAAAALHAADAALRVHVFEKSDLRARGAAVMVGANGLMALDAIDSSIVARLMDKAVNLKGAGAHAQAQKMKQEL
jgi:2-polyprenyl-6-methoxyphenol hydroxylase-like FAD-dependent oxidoreductase